MRAKKGCFVGRLTTHVLDMAHGCPGAGIAVRLYTDDGFEPIARATTNADGRCDAPLLEGPTMKPGRYILAFEAGAYFRDKGMVLADPPFLDTVRIAFGIADAEGHYHVPLLLSPFGYSTYRGS